MFVARRYAHQCKNHIAIPRVSARSFASFRVVPNQPLPGSATRPSVRPSHHSYTISNTPRSKYPYQQRSTFSSSSTSRPPFISNQSSQRSRFSTIKDQPPHEHHPSTDPLPPVTPYEHNVIASEQSQHVPHHPSGAGIPSRLSHFPTIEPPVHEVPHTLAQLAKEEAATAAGTAAPHLSKAPLPHAPASTITGAAITPPKPAAPRRVWWKTALKVTLGLGLCSFGCVTYLVYRQWLAYQAMILWTRLRVWRHGLGYLYLYANPDYLEMDIPLITVGDQCEDIVRKQQVWFHSAYKLDHYLQESSKLWQHVDNLYNNVTENFSRLYKSVADMAGNDQEALENSPTFKNWLTLRKFIMPVWEHSMLQKQMVADCSIVLAEHAYYFATDVNSLQGEELDSFEQALDLSLSEVPLITQRLAYIAQWSSYDLNRLKNCQHLLHNVDEMPQYERLFEAEDEQQTNLAKVQDQAYIDQLSQIQQQQQPPQFITQQQAEQQQQQYEKQQL